MSTPTYSYSDDSSLLAEALSTIGPVDRLLEIGVGNASNLRDYSENCGLALGTDIQSLAQMKSAKSKEIELVITDKASCFRNGTFDVVAFNPPYLPSEQIIDRTVDGGKTGVETPLSFLDEAIRVSHNRGRIVLVLSSLGDLEEFQSSCKRKGLRYKVLREKKLFFETLYAYIVTKH